MKDLWLTCQKHVAILKKLRPQWRLKLPEEHWRKKSGS